MMNTIYSIGWINRKATIAKVFFHASGPRRDSDGVNFSQLMNLFISERIFLPFVGNKGYNKFKFKFSLLIFDPNITET